MGQAKRRGTFEERKATAIRLAGIEREERKRLEAERLAAMSEEERQRRRDNELAMVQFMSVCLAAGVVPYVLPNRCQV